MKIYKVTHSNLIHKKFFLTYYEIRKNFLPGIKQILKNFFYLLKNISCIFRKANMRISFRIRKALKIFE